MKTIYDKLVEKNMLNVLDNWDYEKNGNPKTTPYHSTLRVSLICKKCGYRYETRIDHVLEGRKCIKCASKERSLKRTKKLIENGNTLSNLFPSLVEEWDYEKNNPLTPDDIAAKSPKKVWWKCENGHSWYASPNTRITNNVISKCPYCCGLIAIKGENDFGTLFPNLLKEWDFKKNGDLDPHSLKAQSNKKVWWKCENGHSWKQVIATRTKFNVNIIMELLEIIG